MTKDAIRNDVCEMIRKVGEYKSANILSSQAGDKIVVILLKAWKRFSKGTSIVTIKYQLLYAEQLFWQMVTDCQRDKVAW